MSFYPPPPPGWDTRKAPSTPPVDPAAAERALLGWAQTRGFELNTHPDVRWYQAWSPFVFMFSPTRVGRELKAATHEASAWIVEAFDEDSTTPDDAYLVAFVTSPRLQYRGAIRSRLQKEAIDELRTQFNPRRTPRPNVRWRWREREGFLRRTYGRSVRGLIGDAIFEAHYEIATPTREEGNAAFPVALRHLLVHGGWRGILELRPGGMVVATYGPPVFDPPSLDQALTALGQIYATATRNDGAVPSSGPSSTPHTPHGIGSGTLIDGPSSGRSSGAPGSMPVSSAPSAPSRPRR
jgi:hypothetical protein